MKLRALRQLFLVIAVIPLIAVVGLRSAWASYLCAMDGAVRDACCCPKGDDGKETDEQPAQDPQLEARCCCDVSVHETPPAPQGTLTSAAVADAPAVVPTVMMPTPAPVVLAIIGARDADARPPPRVPIFLDKHAILR